jgi:hypothetical protein
MIELIQVSLLVVIAAAGLGLMAWVRFTRAGQLTSPQRRAPARVARPRRAARLVYRTPETIAPFEPAP